MNLLRFHFPIKGFFHLIIALLLVISSGCGDASEMSFSSSDTKEGEKFIKSAEEDWTEIRLISTAQYWLAKGEPFDHQKVQGRILKLQNKTTEEFKNLLQTRKISKSQYERYMKILGGVSDQ